MNWYLIRTQFGKERRVSERINLMRSRDGIDEITAAMVPVREQTKDYKGQRRRVEEPAFPGYVLIQMDMTDDAWRAVRGVLDVQGFVGAEQNEHGIDIPEALSEAEVETFINNDAPAIDTVDLKPGDTVQVNSGPFESMTGQVSDVNDSDGRIVIEISVFGRITPLDLHHSQVTRY